MTPPTIMDHRHRGGGKERVMIIDEDTRDRYDDASDGVSPDVQSMTEA